MVKENVQDDDPNCFNNKMVEEGKPNGDDNKNGKIKRKKDETKISHTL